MNQSQASNVHSAALRIPLRIQPQLLIMCVLEVNLSCNRVLSASSAILLAATLAQPLAAEVKDRIYINPAVGFQYFDDKRDLSESGTYSVGIEYRLLDRWAVEGVYGNADPDRKHSPGHADYKDYRLDGLYYFDDINSTDVVQPYLAAGAGHTEFDSDGEARVNAGAGLRLVASDMVSLRLDGRQFYSVDEDLWDSMVSVGISFAFNRQAEVAPEPAPAPMPADSDNDGVPDSRDQCPNTAAGVSVNAQGCPLDSDNDGVADHRDACANTEAGAKVDDKGCEGVTERVETISLSIQFANNSSVVRPAYDNEIRQVAEFMKKFPETRVEIAGHSDSTGLAQYNLDLSQLRAQAVATRLTERFDIAADRITARGYGETQPVADNSTTEGRKQNRRVEARIEKVIR